MADSLLYCIFLTSLLLIVHNSDGQGSRRITPPPVSDSPTEANGRLYNLHYVPVNCRDPLIMVKEEFEGGGVIIKNKMVIMAKYGPYNIQGNIEIAPSGCLVIMPGTEMYFSPGFGILTNGTLIARGSYLPGQRILMTKSPNASEVVGPNSPWPDDARLVDGNTTQDGRLDLLYSGKWRGVCTNYKNFTEVDLNVTCRHLGFVYGNFTYHSFARNETDYMLYEKPACVGNEKSLFQCPGRVNIKYGARICDGQQVIGFSCVGLRPDLAKDHWRGLEFYNSTVGQVIDNNLFYNRSLSFLEYLDISYAGLDMYYGDGFVHGLASISASPLVPMINNITISHGAFDGMNLTDVRGEIHIANSTISHNRGYGILIKTAVGRTLINMTDVTHNWADGIKMYMVNYTINQFNKDYPTSDSFCRTQPPNMPSFPVILYEDLIDPVGQKPIGSSCTRMYQTRPGKMITLHVLMMERDPEASGKIIIRDGSNYGPIILQFDINNGTFPQSVTTRTSEVWIKMEYFVPPRPPEGMDQTKRCKHERGCIRFMMELTTNYGPDIELRLYNASVSNNTGYGVNVQDIRSKVSINSSVISDNGYGAGLRVYQGAGEIAVNNTRIERNMKSGVNITYSGGYQLFNLTTVSDNYGYGVITEYLRINRTRYELMHKMEVVKSYFTFNEWTAFRIGNYCRGGEYLFNQSIFANNWHEAIEYLSCNISTTVNTNFSMAYNIFTANKRHAVLISPVVNTVGIFTNNTFQDHTLGVLRINNGYDFVENRWYRKFVANYRIFANKFMNNRGRYVVNFRLTQTSPFQSLDFKFNEVFDNNITDDFMYLNPRSRANAVIVVSSGNVKVQRNFIYNPLSLRDIATHLIDPSVTISADYNWWNSRDHEFVYMRLFDQNSRYNLAMLHYHPVLRNEWLYGNYDTSDEPEHRWQFNRGTRIGGVLDGLFTTDSTIHTYYVDRDIVILKDSTLDILPGTTFKFETSIGMVIHGRLHADGAKWTHVPPKSIFFKMLDDDVLPLMNRTIYDTIRLVDGSNNYEGRLELNISGEVGTVCNEGWTEQNSALVCQQLGLTYNPAYGKPQQINYATGLRKIWLSHVECDTLDTDIMECRAEKYREFQCDHTQDVFIRCQAPTWSGVTIAAIPRFGTTFMTKIRHLVIDGAGLLDFAEMTYTPGLNIHYNFYSISYLTVKNCVSDGINIKYSHPYSRNLIEHVLLEKNLGNGILTRSPYLQLSHLTIRHNDLAGIKYDPAFTEYEALSVRNFIAPGRTISITDNSNISIGNNQMIFLTCPSSEGLESHTYWVQLSTPSPTFRLTVQVLDYNPLTSLEKVTIYDSAKSEIGTAKKWSIEEDLVDFPIVSRYNRLTIEYTVNGVRSGRLAFAITSKGYSESKIFSKIHVLNATIQYNERGILTKHYNNPSNEKMEIFHRVKKEEISFDNILVEHNRKEGMFIPSLTKYHENFIPTFEEMTRPAKVGAITYIIIHAKFLNNAKGIHAEHNHVDFANNVWKWNVTYTDVIGCASGGFEIELPRVNDLIERQTHEVLVRECRFTDNRNFAFGINGYYANVTIMNNLFNSNKCLRGLVTLSGMEKELKFMLNRMENNEVKYVVDLDLKSHSEYSETVNGVFMYNILVGNRNSFVSTAVGTSNTPTTYSFAIRGVQNITANRNVLDNSELQYELVAGIKSLDLHNTVDVKENFWGTTDQYKIKERIFDFDDWNNFAIAEYFPMLTVRDINGDLATGQLLSVELDLYHLGGRIRRDLVIPARGVAYIVYSDLTVMPGVTLTIQGGTELQFYPNVGILVLGKLIANGVPYSRIKMGPVGSVDPGYIPPVSSALTSANMRFIGGSTENEGFMELYNSSSKSWNLMCDSQFNEKTGEVVCRELGFETVNVKVRFTHLYDYFVYGKAMYFLKEFWAYSYYCRGDEERLDFCMKRINYNIKPCVFAANYTFIRCGKRNLPHPLDYWGNIRFANPKYEEELNYYNKRDEERSLLQYVDVYGAGMLHGEKVGAIQTTYVSPIMSNINVTNCVSNGLDVVAPRQTVDIVNQNISGNLGYAVNVLILNGDSTTSSHSSFIPLTSNTVPYNLYGLVEICRMEKEIILENRLILFYKYSQSPVDCVKIITGLSSVGSKKVALRFLQFSLFHDDFYRNSIEIFDGKEITQTNKLAELVANSSQSAITRQYVADSHTLTIHIHASPSYSFYGFVAEVVTLPLSGLTYPDDRYFHNIKHSIITNNQDGALLYKNVGEINPSIMVDHCWIEGNGHAILNLTSPPIINIGLQSTKELVIKHSFISRNKGGTYISATTPSAATKLRANVTNNVFAFNTNGEVLNLTGHHYEKFLFYENYIFNNTAGDYRDIIHVQNVVVNFTYNTVTKNTGHYVIRLYNTEQTEATQEYTKNLMWENNATALYRALIHVGSGNPKINHNFLVNEECDFELETNPIHILPNGLPGYNAPIDAKNNWWGSYSTGYVNGKIWDKLDNASLVAVDFMPIKVSNESLIYGKCAPGWILEDERCYRYMGAALPYYEADQFCKDNEGFLAEAKGRQEFLKYLLQLTQNVYDPQMRVWVYSEVAAGRCSAIERNYVVEEYDCYYTLHPFICEKVNGESIRAKWFWFSEDTWHQIRIPPRPDHHPSNIAMLTDPDAFRQAVSQLCHNPYISAPDSSIYAAVIGIAAGAFGFAVIVIVVLACLWWVKSRRRTKERFERTESMRSSIRGSVKSRSTMSMLSSKHNLDKYSVSSSRYGYDDRSLGASQISLGGVTEDESVTDPQVARQRLRQRAEMARGRPDEDAKYDRFQDRNGHAGAARHGRRRRSRDDVSDRSDERKASTHSSHTNSGYKYSDESRGQSDVDNNSDVDEKRRYFENEEEADKVRNSFTPVKFRPRVEKELDSIRIKEMNSGAVDYNRRQIETPSVDMSDSGRHLSRSMSSFSQPSNDSQERLGEAYQEDRAPTPPNPLPMNIPMKPKSPTRVLSPTSRPVPAPRPKTRSTDSSEMLSDSKLNNLSQDEASERGSRDRLDRAGYRGDMLPKKASSRENLNDPVERPYNYEMRGSRENMSGSRGNIADLGVGVDYLSRARASPAKMDEDDNGRDSPNHQSSENLLPQNLKGSRENLYTDDKPKYLYQPDMYNPNVNSSKEYLYPSGGHLPQAGYTGRDMPQETDFADGTGVDYLPRNTGNPVDTRFGGRPQPSPVPSPALVNKPAAGYRASPTPVASNNPPSFTYQPGHYDENEYTPGYDYANDYTPSPGYQDSYNSPAYGNYGNQSQDVTDTQMPYENVGGVGIDYLPRSNIPTSEPQSRDNISRSRENLSRSRENLNRSRENLSRSREDELRENSRDTKKPRQYKSIETEI